MNKDLTLLYASQFIKELSNALVAVFIPIFLYKEMGIDISIVLLVYAAWFFIYGFLIYFPFKYLVNFGTKTFVIIGTILNSTRFYFLYLGQVSDPWWFIAFVINSMVYELFYFSAIRVDEIRFTEKKYRGEEGSVIKTLLIIAGVFAPLIGGIIADTLGFTTLFITAALGTLLSLIPLIFARNEYPDKINFSVKSLVTFYHEKKIKRFFLVFMADGFKSMNLDVLWPIFLFLLIPSYTKVGGLTSLIILSSIFLTIYVGYLVDKFSKHKILSIAAKSNTFAWFAKCLLYALSTVSIIHVLIVNAFSKFAEVLLQIPYDTVILDKGSVDKDSLLKFSLIEKFFRQMGRSLFTVIIVIIGIFISVEGMMIVSFIVVALLSLSTPLITKDK